jgi:osmoprotectant transport system permease protein
MDLLAGIVAWFLEPDHWQGPAGVPSRLLEHAAVSGGALVVAMAIALPVGLLVGHTGRGATLAINLANLGRALPTFAVMGLVIPITAAIDSDLGFKVYPALVGLVILAIPPILVNTYAGVSGVDRDIVEAGRAMGMRPSEVLTRVEVPVALPVISGGIRSGAAQIIATATLAAVFGGPGLGRYLVEGYAQRDYPMMFAGVILVAAMFGVVELAFAAAQRALTSPGLRSAAREGTSRPARAGASSS